LPNLRTSTPRSGSPFEGSTASGPRPLKVEENVPLAPLSTLGVGGPARYFVRAGSAAEVAAAVDWAHSRVQPLLVLGGGSNLVIADAGFPGLVLEVAVRGHERNEQPDRVTLSVGAGEPWDDFVRSAVEYGWAGVECLSGIPGRVGATPIQNVGAYGQDVSETIAAVDAVDVGTGRRVTFTAEECGFAYRDSRFKGADRGRYVVVGVTFRLRPGAPPAARYPEVQRILDERGLRHPSLGDVRGIVLEVRRRKSMVVDAADAYSRSVGSFFVNPVVPAAKADRVEQDLRTRGHLSATETLPRYSAGPDRVKLPAAWLIEHSGLARGVRRGAVGLSPHHALAIVNHGGATAADVVSFAREVRDRVRDRCGISLVPEPVFVGLAL
jgi:UDP-N-acetylmuramate dehydrogenase